MPADPVPDGAVRQAGVSLLVASGEVGDQLDQYIIEFNRSSDLDDTARPPLPTPQPPFAILVVLWRSSIFLLSPVFQLSLFVFLQLIFYTIMCTNDINTDDS